MSDIKIKKKNNSIKTINKAIVGTKKIKDNLVYTKQKIDNDISSKEDNNESKEIINNFSNTIKKEVDTISHVGNYNIKKTSENISKVNNKIKLKKENNYKSISSNDVNKIKTRKNVLNVKSNTNMIKKNYSNKKYIFSKKNIQKVSNMTEKLIKSTISSIKTLIESSKALISFLIAGGWVVLLIIIVICIIGLFCSSIFGIFFSSDKDINTKTMNTVVLEINREMADKISDIQISNPYDEYVIESNRAEWKDVLSIYTVKTYDDLSGIDVITIDETKEKALKQIFWDMNTITSEIRIEKNLDGESKRILYININCKTNDEMMKKYMFNIKQQNQVKELLNKNYDSLWKSVIYGTSINNSSIVDIALSQIGNIGGEPYWSWYGFTSRVEWCACFVSWVAEQAGYIEKNIIPKFSGCQNGINWFKAVGGWQDSEYIPNSGDIVFFDWENDGNVDHVGIVEKIEDNKIYTIEGNSIGDMCRENKYAINDKVIYGFGVPNY